MGFISVQDLIGSMGPYCNEGLLISYFSPDTMIFRGGSVVSEALEQTSKPPMPSEDMYFEVLVYDRRAERNFSQHDRVREQHRR